MARLESSLLQRITLTGYEPNEDREFPRLNGRTFIIWKTRVTVALENKNLLGVVERIDYTGDVDFYFDSDEELNSALPDMDNAFVALGAAEAPSFEAMADSLPGESSSHNSFANSEPPPLETTVMWTSGKKTPAIHCL
ncbi:Hypothetical protein PHPALM_12562 [Phytophthora palmivora]|uniref:Uncharacterized protein n=1 Tax=Phytophthora palmivora TaxID=4796 RepID=A0A2P4XZF2_9STRA|nr:Hypothetical protein PHPALM_12562 [Phytophthora palmivora]